MLQHALPKESDVPSSSSTRVLFLDDSGKPSFQDATRAVVIGGFSIPSADVPILSRRIAGAKSHFYAERGDPGKWEVKAIRTIRRDFWSRSKNRNFLAEVVRILNQLQCTVYTVSIDKCRMHHPMTLKTTMPLQLQVLVEHFAVECGALGEMGLIVSDWSSHGLDAHASKSVASFVITRQLPLHPTVYYANSLSSHAIQIADLVAGTRRRAIEGDPNLQQLDTDLAAIRVLATSEVHETHTGRLYANRISVI